MRRAAPLPLLAPLSFAFGAMEARAQRPDATPIAIVASHAPVAPGMRVRLSGPERRITGVLVAWREDTLFVTPDRVRDAPDPPASGRGHPARRSEPRADSRAVPWLAGGFAGHAITDRGTCRDCDMRGVGVLIGIPAGTGAGALLGSLVGTLRPSERWDTLATPSRLAESRSP